VWDSFELGAVHLLRTSSAASTTPSFESSIPRRFLPCKSLTFLSDPSPPRIGMLVNRAALELTPLHHILATRVSCTVCCLATISSISLAISMARVRNHITIVGSRALMFYKSPVCPSWYAQIVNRPITNNHDASILQLYDYLLTLEAEVFLPSPFSLLTNRFPFHRSTWSGCQTGGLAKSSTS
jgi:hypothetical protein